MLVLLVKPGTRGANKQGPNPRLSKVDFNTQMDKFKQAKNVQYADQFESRLDQDMADHIRSIQKDASSKLKKGTITQAEYELIITDLNRDYPDSTKG